MCRSPGITEACIDVYDFGQDCSGTSANRPFRNISATLTSNVYCGMTLVNSVLESVTFVMLILVFSKCFRAGFGAFSTFKLKVVEGTN